MLLIAEPGVHKLEQIGFRIVPPDDLDQVGNIPETLLEPGRGARMHPEHPCLWRPLEGTVAVLDSKL